MFILISIALLAFGSTFVDSTGIWLLFFSQAALLLGEVFRRQVSGTGGFIFMSFLFFGVRPIYITLENDYSLVNNLFRVYPNFAQIHDNMVWGTLALVVFKLGSLAIHAWKSPSLQVNEPAGHSERALVSDKLVGWLVVFQIFTLPVMAYLAFGGRALYGSALGAFAYDFPVVMQAGHIFGFVVILERYLQRRKVTDLTLAIGSAIIFLYFTWLMREVSMFRGFYLAGVMIVGLAALDRILPRVSLVWLILPILLLQPLFQILGSTRYVDNKSLVEYSLIEQAFDEESIAHSYWEFYSGKGDINIFDTFVAARASEPSVTPYIWSWAYAPLHVIPRKLWSGKPEKGITQDLSFMYGAPYCPGIAGFFWLDGASDLWMLFSMGLLGAIVGYLDCRVFSMKNSYLKSCFLGILAVNCMFLTRFFLWAALWQTLYAVVPCYILYKVLVLRNNSNENVDAEIEDSASVRSLYSNSSNP